MTPKVRHSQTQSDTSLTNRYPRYRLRADALQPSNRSLKNACARTTCVRFSRCGCARPSGAAAIGTKDVLIYAVFCALIAAEPRPPPGPNHTIRTTDTTDTTSIPHTCDGPHSLTISTRSPQLSIQRPLGLFQCPLGHGTSCISDPHAPSYRPPTPPRPNHTIRTTHERHDKHTPHVRWPSLTHHRHLITLALPDPLLAVTKAAWIKPM